MKFGPNAGPVTVLRRAVQDDTGGVSRGEYAIAFVTQADWRPRGGREAVDAGLPQDELQMTFRVHDGARNRTITAADMLVIGRISTVAGAMRAAYSVENVMPPDRLEGSITINATRRVS